MSRRVRNVIFCLGLAACHATTTDPPQTASVPTAAPARDAAPPRDAAPQPTPVFHLSQVDETNIALLPNGAFVWRIFGCDFSGGGDGRWVALGPKHYQLLPSKGTTLEWPGKGGVGAVTSVDVEVMPTGELHTHTLAVTGPLDQIWQPGRVCAVCGGLGPSGQPVICSDAFP